MQKYKLLSLLFLIPFFTSCSDKTTALNHFEKNPQAAFSIQYTKKRDLLFDKKIVAMFFATYLNKTNEKYKSEDNNSFIVGVHLINEKLINSKNKKFKVFLNDKKAKSITKIENDSNLLKSISLKDSWADYYLVSFDNNKESKKLNLKFISSDSQQVHINFEK